MKVVEAAAQVLNTLWQYRDPRNLYKQRRKRNRSAGIVAPRCPCDGNLTLQPAVLGERSWVSPAVRVEDISKSKNDVPVQPNLNIFPTILMGGRRRSFRPNCPLPRPAAEQGPERRELLHVVTLPTSAPPSRAPPRPGLHQPPVSEHQRLGGGGGSGVITGIPMLSKPLCGAGAPTSTPNTPRSGLPCPPSFVGTPSSTPTARANQHGVSKSLSTLSVLRDSSWRDGCY
ncbi:uncharacterized protein LOC114551266 [Perca flavescens]|uniref:uncharacterized protein LOC114551266 n=1 Tax=Perca flavescens TaxID=8167 RepID=UPI00106E0CF8|nr:uncharacterized protein LOC114551266 [Perca flavescens]